MKKSPEISIIIPVYNDESYLENCLNSIINQSFTDYEVVLVNDGSTDGTSEICNKYCEMDSRFFVKHQANTGVAEARNVGISLSRGKYIMFVDSDDTVNQDFCRIPYEIAEANHAEIVVFCYNFLSNEKKCIYGPSCSTVGKKTSDEVLYLLEDVEIFMWNKLYARHLFSGIKFIPGLICEEHAVLPKLIHKASCIYLSDAVLYNYHIRNDSISFENNMNLDFANNHYQMVNIKANDLMNWGYSDLSQKYRLKESFYYLYWFGLKAEYSLESIHILKQSNASPYFSWRQNLMIFVLKHNRFCFSIICRITKVLRRHYN